MIRAELVPCYLLHSRRFRETSLLLDVLALGYGRVGLVARGARGSKGRSGVLQCFQPLRLSWMARGELGTLTDAEADGVPLLLRGERLMCGLYLNELLVRTLPRDDSASELFPAYLEALNALPSASAPAWVLRRFELALLEASGYSLGEPGFDAEGQPLQSGLDYRFDPDHGLIVDSVAGASAAGNTVSGAAMLALHGRAEASPEHAGTLRRFLAVTLHTCLGETTLRSRAWLRDLRQLSNRSSMDPDS